MNIIETERLILRTWREEDAEKYFQINQDEKVLEFLPGPMTMEQVTNFMSIMNQQWHEKHYTLWAVDEKAGGNFIGFIGLSWLAFPPPFVPGVEIGWRLGSQYWGQGFATEGAMASMRWGFEECGLDEIIAITVPDNRRSQRVMDKLGMRRDMSGDFAHPRLSTGHRLSQHVLYRIKK